MNDEMIFFSQHQNKPKQYDKQVTWVRTTTFKIEINSNQSIDEYSLRIEAAISISIFLI